MPLDRFVLILVLVVVAAGLLSGSPARFLLRFRSRLPGGSRWCRRFWSATWFGVSLLTASAAKRTITMTRLKSEILAVTSDGIPGQEISQAIGIVRGSTVRAKHLGSDIVASLRNLVGGEVKEYAQLLAGAREQAFDRMLEEASQLGADAVVAVGLRPRPSSRPPPRLWHTAPPSG